MICMIRWHDQRATIRPDGSVLFQENCTGNWLRLDVKPYPTLRRLVDAALAVLPQPGPQGGWCSMAEIKAEMAPAVDEWGATAADRRALGAQGIAWMD